MVMALVGAAVVFVYYGCLAVALEVDGLEVASFAAAESRFHGAYVGGLDGVFPLLVA